jgi:tetratricopeptide (TPR) repeat protein
MQRIACGFFAMLTLVAQAARGQGQQHLDANAPGWRQSSFGDDSVRMRWMMTNETSAQPLLASAPAGKVSVNTLEIPEAARKEMHECVRNFEAGKLEDSIKHAEKALRISPQWAGAHQDLGQIYARLRQYQKAIEEFHNAAALDARMVQPWVSLASANLVEGQYAEGEKAARRALEIDPANSDARYVLGRILALAGHDLTDAIALLREGEEQHPAAYLAVANIYLKQNQTEEALGELRGYLADPNAPQKEKVTCMVEKLTKPAGTVNCAIR